MDLLKTGEVLKGWDKEKQEFIFEDVKLDDVEFTLYADGDIVTQDGQSTDNARDTWFKDGDKVAVLTTGKGVEFRHNVQTDKGIGQKIAFGHYVQTG